ncbi:unnamed protein product [Cuscuta europaea]|uniref:Nuclear pore complex protein NUP43 n=1 Tax=Cuscuta europaea TaxID=41803 RepID=A0A9P0ZPP3_CUSEU|nr:unnamed protein product [Cuscuta europaea]
MALTTPVQLHRFPQRYYIDGLRWLPRLSAFHRHIILAAFESDTSSPYLQLLSLSQSQHSDSDPEIPELSVESSLSTPSRISSLRACRDSSKPLIAAATSSGSLSILSADLMNGSLNVETSVSERAFHSGPILGIDVSENGSDVVSVGEDGKVNWINIGGGIGEKLKFQNVSGNNGLVSYHAVKWASPVEFVTGGLGLSLQWWDLRRPGGPAYQFKGDWNHGGTSGIVHSIDIHPSRKHACLAGGSSGTVFVWDLRRQQSIALSGIGTNDSSVQALSESEVWEVQYDCPQSSSSALSSASCYLPAMICSEDGILGVIEQGEEPIELLAEPCAINSFDIDKQNPSDVICSLEWESIAILSRSAIAATARSKGF